MPIGVTSLALLAGYLKSQVPPPTKYQAPVGRDNYLGIGTMKIKKGGEKKWIQDAVKRPGRCTPFPNPDCMPGTPQYNLAKRFKSKEFNKHGGACGPNGIL